MNDTLLYIQCILFISLSRVTKDCITFLFGQAVYNGYREDTVTYSIYSMYGLMGRPINGYTDVEMDRLGLVELESFSPICSVADQFDGLEVSFSRRLYHFHLPLREIQSSTC